jgi:hypothetical protein
LLGAPRHPAQEAHLDEHPALQQQLRVALVAQARRAAASTGTTATATNGASSAS